MFLVYLVIGALQMFFDDDDDDAQYAHTDWRQWPVNMLWSVTMRAFTPVLLMIA